MTPQVSVGTNAAGRGYRSCARREDKMDRKGDSQKKVFDVDFAVGLDVSASI